MSTALDLISTPSRRLSANLGQKARRRPRRPPASIVRRSTYTPRFFNGGHTAAVFPARRVRRRSSFAERARKAWLPRAPWMKLSARAGGFRGTACHRAKLAARAVRHQRRLERGDRRSRAGKPKQPGSARAKGDPVTARRCTLRISMQRATRAPYADIYWLHGPGAGKHTRPFRSLRMRGPLLKRRLPAEPNQSGRPVGRLSCYGIGPSAGSLPARGRRVPRSKQLVNRVQYASAQRPPDYRRSGRAAKPGRQAACGERQATGAR